jgi:hypothetical protein
MIVIYFKCFIYKKSNNIYIDKISCFLSGNTYQNYLSIYSNLFNSI